VRRHKIANFSNENYDTNICIISFCTILLTYYATMKLALLYGNWSITIISHYVIIAVVFGAVILGSVTSEDVHNAYRHVGDFEWPN